MVTDASNFAKYQQQSSDGCLTTYEALISPINFGKAQDHSQRDRRVTRGPCDWKKAEGSTRIAPFVAPTVSSNTHLDSPSYSQHLKL
ncbi:hypothetical protein L1887_20625 [Cichorium endivia]|nr:hypothetical protein L1887_20625 [Cichorium endivia]